MHNILNHYHCFSIAVDSDVSVYTELSTCSSSSSSGISVGVIAGIAVGAGCMSIIIITIIVTVCIGFFAVKSVRRPPHTVVVGDETASPQCTALTINNTNQQQTHNAHQPARIPEPPITAQWNYSTQPIQYLQQNPCYSSLQQEFSNRTTEAIVNSTEAAQEADEHIYSTAIQ